MDALNAQLQAVRDAATAGDEQRARLAAVMRQLEDSLGAASVDKQVGAPLAPQGAQGVV